MDKAEERNVQDAQREIERIFKGLSREVPILLFAQPGRNDMFCDYARQAIERFGLLRGVLLAVRRLGRCNPFFPGGSDPLPSSVDLNKE